MSQPVSVKVSSRYQISVPRIAREKLGIQSGDRLLVDVQDGVLILIPKPQDYVAHLAGLHKEIWADVDTTTHLDKEREAWNNSDNN